MTTEHSSPLDQTFGTEQVTVDERRSRIRRVFEAVAPRYNLTRLVIPRLGAAVARQPIAYQYLIESIRRFPNQTEFAALVEQAGFTKVTWENLSFGIACLHVGVKS